MRKSNGKRKNLHLIWGVLLCVLSVAFAAGNLGILFNSAERQLEERGKARLQQVSSQVQKMLDDSKIMLLRFAADVEVYLEQDAGLPVMQSYLKSQSRIFSDQSDNTFMNAYLCTDGWVLISDSPLPEDYRVTERDWYASTVESGIGNIYISPPYRDAFTGRMCFTAALLLSDGRTIAGLDFNLSKVQSTVEALAGDGEDLLILNRNGVIIGCRDNSLAGERIEDALPEYTGAYNRLLNDKSDDPVLEATIEGKTSRIFCNRSDEWMLLYKTVHQTLFQMPYLWIWINLLLNLLMLGGAFLFFVTAIRSRRKAEEALEDRESFLDGLSEKMYDPINAILRDSALIRDGAAGDISGQSDAIRQIRRSAVALSDMVENLFSYREVKQEMVVSEKKREDQTRITAITKNVRNGIMAAMLAAIAVAIVFTGIVLVGWGNDRMEREVDPYNYQLANWTNTQMQTLNMFVDTIAANPAVLDDYDFAVEYLDRIVRNHSEISAAYIARPGNEHEMTMNNGWVPHMDYIVAEREWYVDTVNSETGINISTPYLDARTGLYCVTFSRVVFSAETGEQIGVFALDFYIGNLTSIMKSSYSDTGYAFLVDNSSVIVNHPNGDYQISKAQSVNVADTEYERVMNDRDVHFIRDYDGRLKVSISRTENVAGFTVVAVKNLYTVYGVVILTAQAFILLLIVCIILMYKLIMRMVRWQEEVWQSLSEEADRASRADRAKSVFLAQMSHEIRTPINVVLGMNETILRESGEEEILEYASNAYSAGRTLLSIINDVLDISKIEAGKLEILETEYDLYSLISDCYNLTTGRIRQKDLAFTVTVDETMPARLCGDMFHIRQVLMNLLTNAVKYTDEGSVTLSFRGEWEDDGFFLLVSVKDTGIGLKEENLATLFDSFQRFDLKRNQSVEGAGLGLAICKQLAELMHGVIEVESVYGAGSTFTFRVPQEVVGEGAVGEFRPDRLPERSETEKRLEFTAPEASILVVDDVEMNLRVFISLLKHHDLRIDTAESGRRCLEMIAEKKYDIIFMDHMMPEMNGIETLEHILKLDTPNRDTPVVMLTADAISGEKERFLSAGFVSYLTKPIQSGRLEQVIVEYLPAEKVHWGAGQSSAPADAFEKRSAPREDGLFDPELGMSYTGEEGYPEVLAAYVESAPEQAEILQDAFAREDWETYVIKVHALKGTSLTVGARQLSEAARELETAGRNGDAETIRRKHGALLELYRAVLELCKQYLRELPVPEGSGAGALSPAEAPESQALTETDRETVLAWLEEIRQAAEGFDGGAIADLCARAEGRSLNGAPLEPLFREIRQAALDFEYDAAAERAKAAAGEIAGKST